MSGHTPGPWTVEHATGIEGEKLPYVGSLGDGPGGVCDLYHSCDHGKGLFVKHNAEANALLLAASPDLLEALKTLVDAHSIHPDGYCSSGRCSVCIAIVKAREAIGKAEGTTEKERTNDAKPNQ